jgi:valyl-tRNA synthetase
VFLNSNRYEFGVIYKFKFPVEGGSEFLEISTTRPETMLGDTAVAIHPDDSRYTVFFILFRTHSSLKKFHNRFVIHPLTGERIPIITDATLVDPAFGTESHHFSQFFLGTGVVKVV